MQKLEKYKIETLLLFKQKRVLNVMYNNINNSPLGILVLKNLNISKLNFFNHSNRVLVYTQLYDIGITEI